MMTARQIADYFLALQDDESGDLISNLKLQKLLYFAQGLYLASFGGQPLFPESIFAWKHGPVVPDIYHAFKDYKSDSIPRPIDLDFSVYSDPIKEFLNEIYDVFGQFSAWKLRNMSHETPSYQRAEAFSEEITHESMRDYFKCYIKA